MEKRRTKNSGRSRKRKKLSWKTSSYERGEDEEGKN